VRINGRDAAGLRPINPDKAADARRRLSLSVGERDI
jgi:hypothetical protein